MSPTPALISVGRFRHIPIIFFKYFGYMIVELNLNFGHLTNGFRTADRGLMNLKLLNKIISPRVSSYHGNSRFIFPNARASRGLRPLGPPRGALPLRTPLGVPLPRPPRTTVPL